MLVLRANAKLNLALAVIARRDDGWHDIDSIMVPIDWHDLVGITLRPAEHANVSLLISGPASAGVPAGDDNLAVRAGRALVEAAGRPLDISVWLDKHVPHAAGLGGGSADAAVILRAGPRLIAEQGVAFDTSRLSASTVALGSDVPALVQRGPQRITQRGDVLSPVAAPELSLVVVVTEPSSTSAVYAAVAVDELGDVERIDRLTADLAFNQRPPDSLLGSALEGAAGRVNLSLARSVERVRAVIPGRRWHMTGSGGALFSLTDTASEARHVATRMRDAGFVSRASFARGRPYRTT